MICVHHLNNSRSQRVLWLLEELGLDYDIVRYERDESSLLAPPGLRSVHPLGKSPVITDGDRTIAESGAIIEYLVGWYGDGRLAPAPRTEERLRYTYWMHYAEGSAMPQLLLAIVFRRIPKSPMPFFVRPIARGICDKVLGTLVEPQLERHTDYLESELSRSTWFASDAFTAADIQMSFVVEALVARSRSAASKNRLNDWLARIHARPAHARALERGGPFEVPG